MAVSFKIISKSVIRFIWKYIRKFTSFLTTLIIISAFVITALFLMKIKPYVVTTGSMEPAIPVKSVCFVNENIPLENINVGEVISFRISNDVLVTHRVTKISGEEYTTKGDANNTEDFSTVTKQNYIGKTVFVIPKVGFILICLHSRKGRIIAVTLIVLLLILSFIPENKNQKSK